MEEGTTRHMPRRDAIALIGGAACLAATLILAPPAGLSPAGWHTLGLALTMAVWWTTEPVPIGVTALMPLIVLPLLGVADFTAAAAPYANPLVFLFLGGFLLAGAIRRWGLHRRLAFAVVRRIGLEPHRLVLGFMVATGFLSMWISNTAAVVLMLPVAVSVVSAIEDLGGRPDAVRRFALALLLGLAYAASIGGVGTLIGTPPNALLAGYLSERYDIDLSFAAWSAVAMPLVIVFLPLAWLALTRVVHRFPPDLFGDGKEHVAASALPPMAAITPAERRVGAVFVAAAVLWITRPLLNRLPLFEGLTDSGIALICGSILFVIPAGIASERRPVMTWSEAREIPWQVLLLFGGGLSLAAAMDQSGLAVWLGHGLAALDTLPPFLFIVVVVSAVVVLTELTSNTATVAALLPVVAILAAGEGLDIVTVSAALAMAASCAFMLPVATPPNALVFGSGHVTVLDMVRAGLVMNLISIVLVSLAARLGAPFLAAATGN